MILTGSALLAAHTCMHACTHTHTQAQNTRTVTLITHDWRGPFLVALCLSLCLSLSLFVRFLSVLTDSLRGLDTVVSICEVDKSNKALQCFALRIFFFHIFCMPQALKQTHTQSRPLSHSLLVTRLGKKKKNGKLVISARSCVCVWGGGSFLFSATATLSTSASVFVQFIAKWRGPVFTEGSDLKHRHKNAHRHGGKGKHDN